VDALPPPPPAHVTISLGVLELFPPAVVTVTSEISLPHRFSLALSSGYGTRDVDQNGSTIGTTAAWLGMLCPRWYVLGRFEDGLHVGWTFAYARAVNGPVALERDLLPPPGFSSGPMVGYKARFPWHLSFGFELGVVHDFWIPTEATGVSWVSLWGDLQVGVTL
jgi:hypothetical protein